jgi:hypothetical protein
VQYKTFARVHAVAEEPFLPANFLPAYLITGAFGLRNQQGFWFCAQLAD